jgi:mRNA interferase MazF
LKRGEVYWATIKPRSGSEQTGKRPVIILSSDGFNSIPTWRSVIVIPLSTSGKQAKRGPTAVMLPKGEGGLAKDSIALFIR